MLRSRALRTLALAVTAVASVSCGDFTGATSPPTPDSSSLPPPTLSVRAPFAVMASGTKARAVKWGPGHDRSDHRVSALVGPAGATLSLPGADFELAIPEGALAELTTITVTAVAGRHVVYEMQPHGLRFLKPVTAVQDLKNTAVFGRSEGNAVRSAYLSDGNDQIGADGLASPVELEASTTLSYGAQPTALTHIWILNHFSRYILISGAWTCVEGCGSK